MGNRAVLTFETSAKAPAIYLHWNGGHASVEAFLAAARHLGLRHARTPAQQLQAVDFIAAIAARHYMGCDVGETVYREAYGCTDADNGDNGVFLLADDLSINGRRFVRARMREEIDPVKTAEIFEHIIARAPIFNAAAA